MILIFAFFFMYVFGEPSGSSIVLFSTFAGLLEKRFLFIIIHLQESNLSLAHIRLSKFS